MQPIESHSYIAMLAKCANSSKVLPLHPIAAPSYTAILTESNFSQVLSLYSTLSLELWPVEFLKVPSLQVIAVHYYIALLAVCLNLKNPPFSAHCSPLLHHKGVICPGVDSSKCLSLKRIAAHIILQVRP